MRRFSRHFSCPALLIGVAAAILLSQGAALAQFGGLSSEDAVKFTFPGGTLKEYVELVKETFGEDVQVNLAPEVESLSLDRIELNVDSGFMALDLLQHLADGRFEVDTFVGGGFNPNVRISAPRYHTRVFSVRDFINDQKGAPQANAIEMLISAVKVALELGSHSAPEVKLKLHPGTGLLLVSGTQQQVDIVDQVVSQLQPPPGEPETIPQDLEAQIEALERQLRDLRKRLGREREDRESSHTDDSAADISHADPAPSRPAPTGPGSDN